MDVRRDAHKSKITKVCRAHPVFGLPRPPRTATRWPPWHRVPTPRAAATWARSSILWRVKMASSSRIFRSNDPPKDGSPSTRRAAKAARTTRQPGRAVRRCASGCSLRAEEARRDIEPVEPAPGDDLDEIGRRATELAKSGDDPATRRAPGAPAQRSQLSPTVVALFGTLMGMAVVASVAAIAMRLSPREREPVQAPSSAPTVAPAPVAAGARAKTEKAPTPALAGTLPRRRRRERSGAAADRGKGGHGTVHSRARCRGRARKRDVPRGHRLPGRPELRSLQEERSLHGAPGSPDQTHEGVRVPRERRGGVPGARRRGRTSERDEARSQGRADTDCGRARVRRQEPRRFGRTGGLRTRARARHSRVRSTVTLRRRISRAATSSGSSCKRSPPSAISRATRASKRSSCAR